MGAIKKAAMKRVQRIVVSPLVRCDQGILLVQRGRPYREFLEEDTETQIGIDLWELPGGGIDFGETPLQAGVREASEETGIQLEQEKLTLADCCAYTLQGSGCESHRIHLIYETELPAIPAVKTGSEHAAYQWVRDVEEVRRLASMDAIAAIVVRQLQRYF